MVTGVSAALLPVAAVEFYHHAVNFVGEVLALLLPLCAEFSHLGDIAAQLALYGGRLEAEFGQEIQALVVRGETVGDVCALRVFGQAELIHKGFQPAAGSFFGVFHAQAPGSGVARVGEEGEAFFGALFVYFFEAVFADEHLAAQLYAVNAVFGKSGLQGDAPYHSGIGRDLLADGPVAAGGGAQQLVSFIH